MNALTAVCNKTWAITPEYLQTIIEIAAHENPTPEAVEAKLGRPLDNTHDVTMRDGIATIPIKGPLFRYGSFFTRVSGATSIDTLSTDLQTAMDDPSISQIVLYIDSPGGEVNGTSEFAQAVYNARGQKPITAYVSDLGCSAAYWIASAADSVICADTASLGSIGVVAAVRDPAKSKTSSIEFVSSQSPNKRPDVTKDEGKAQIQAHIDALGDVFVNSVARNRGVSADTVLSDFGQGGVFVGQDAVDAGLADAVGTYEGLLKTLASEPGGGDVHVPVPLGPRRKKKAAEADEWLLGETRNGVTFVSMAASSNTCNLTKTYLPDKTLTLGADTDPSPAQEISMDPETITATLQDPRIAELERAVADASAREQAAIERIAALETTKRHAEFAALAHGWHGETNEYVAFMDDLSDENRAFFVQIMTALHEQVKTGALFASAGVTGGVEAGSALEALNAKAAALRKDNPALTKAKAFSLATTQNKDLYTQYLSEVGQN